MNSRWELSHFALWLGASVGLRSLLDCSLIEFKVSSRIISHHLVDKWLWVTILQVYRRMFEIFGTIHFFKAFPIVRLISHWVFRTTTAFSVLVFRSWAVSSTFNFFKLQNVHECYSSHMSIVCSLMVVRKCSLPLIVGTMVFLVKSTFQIVLELVVIGAFFHDLIQAGKVKRFWRCCQSFCIICVRESWVPFLHEL